MYVCVCARVYVCGKRGGGGGIYYKELVHVIMGAEKSQDVQGELPS